MLYVPFAPQCPCLSYHTHTYNNSHRLVFLWHNVLTRLPARIGMSNWIHKFGIHGIPRTTFWGALKPCRSATGVRLRPAVCLHVPKLVTSFEGSILAKIGSRTLPTKCTNRRNTVIISFRSNDKTLGGGRVQWSIPHQDRATSHEHHTRSNNSNHLRRQTVTGDPWSSWSMEWWSYRGEQQCHLR